MHIAVCIVGFRNVEDIALCCAALADSDYADFDVVICENGGEAAAAALQAALPATLASGQRVEISCAPGNLGYAGGVNHCIRMREDADGWWVVNPDARPEAGALAALVARLAKADCDAVGGTLYHRDGKVQAYGGHWSAWLARCESIGIGTRLSDAPIAGAIEARMNYILGGSMLVGRRFRDTVGLMREDYFLYCEEVEWFLRGIALGMRLGFAPDARVAHDQGTTTGSADPIRRRPKLPIYLDERNKLHVVADTSPMRWPVAVIAAFLLLSLRYLRRGAIVQWHYALGGWWAGVRGKRGVPAWLNAR